MAAKTRTVELLHVGTHTDFSTGQEIPITTEILDQLERNFSHAKVELREDPEHMAERMPDIAPASQKERRATVLSIKRIGDVLQAVLGNLTARGKEIIDGNLFGGLSAEIHKIRQGKKELGLALTGAVFTNRMVDQGATLSQGASRSILILDPLQIQPGLFPPGTKPPKERNMATPSKFFKALHMATTPEEVTELVEEVVAKIEDPSAAAPEEVVAIVEEVAEAPEDVAKLLEAAIARVAELTAALEAAKAKATGAEEKADAKEEEATTMAQRVKALETLSQESLDRANKAEADGVWRDLYNERKLSPAEFNQLEDKGKKLFASVLNPVTREATVFALSGRSAMYSGPKGHNEDPGISADDKILGEIADLQLSQDGKEGLTLAQIGRKDSKYADAIHRLFTNSQSAEG